MTPENIPVAGPWITDKEIAYVNDAVANGWYENSYKYQQLFEQAFASYIGVKYAIALPSCTSAIHLALLALGIGPGDEVIVPDITWIATAAPITYVGATPVFADIDEKTWCISAESLRDCITPQTRAVIPVDLYGNLANMDKILSITRHYDLAVIEDAAQAAGSEYKGKKAGSFGDTGVFSFHGSKTMTTGEGGMLLTNSPEIHERCRVLMDHGRLSEGRMFWNVEIAYKYKMSNLQAALGLAQLERINELLERKRQIFEWYREELYELDVSLNNPGENVSSAYWMVTVILKPAANMDKQGLLALMSHKQISCRPFFYPLSMLPAFCHCREAQTAAKRNLVSYRLSPWGINLPSGFNMNREKVSHVCNALKSILTGSKEAG
jgi:perosamine synthetase